MEFLKQGARNLFFTGKGGVGKTTVACAAAVRLADAGQRVLLVSTDPASNLDEVFGVAIGAEPTRVPGAESLDVLNLDPERAAAEYRERMTAPYRGVLPAAAVAAMEEQFSGSCTTEIAAFDEFSRLLADPAATASYDHVLFDTAPTGHTLRLLALPSAWSGFMETNTTGATCLGPLAGLQSQQELYQRSVRLLGDPTATTLVLVARPDETSMSEAARASRELADLGIQNQHLVVNGVFQAADHSDPLAVAFEQRGQRALAALPQELRRLQRTTIRLAPGGVLGVSGLRNFHGSPATLTPPAKRPDSRDAYPLLDGLLDDLAAAGRGVIMTMGKGGVGKTTIASAVAVALAERGHKVHLSTTDPAAHLDAVVTSQAIAGLTVSRIDPAAEVARYSAEVMNEAGAELDEAGKSLLAEDLRSPCTEEIAVFRAFAEAIAWGEEGFAIVDTAPTGHTLLLLDAALSYHREVGRLANNLPDDVARLLPRLRDPEYTRVLLVTLPESTPVHEAAQLQRDLQRAEIEPFAWVVNQCLTPLAVRDPLLVARQQAESEYLREVFEKHARRAGVVPMKPVAPQGKASLLELFACENSAVPKV